MFNILLLPEQQQIPRRRPKQPIHQLSFIPPPTRLPILHQLIFNPPPPTRLLLLHQLFSILPERLRPLHQLFFIHLHFLLVVPL